MCLLAANKIGNDHLSGPDIAIGILRHSLDAPRRARTCADVTQTLAENFRVVLRLFCVVLRSMRSIESTALHSGMDLAVSSSLCCPYGEGGPSSLGCGSSAILSNRDVSARTTMLAHDGCYLPTSIYEL